MDSGYTCVWEFRVAPDSCAEFERHYGPDGTWVQLFRRGAGYLGTWLLKDRSVAGRYLTVDRWQSAAAYRAFRAGFALEYAQLDLVCERLTTDETSLGEFDE